MVMCWNVCELLVVECTVHVHVQLCEVLVLGCLCAKLLLLRVWCCSVSATTMCVPNRSGCHIQRGLVCLISGVVLSL